MNPQRKSSDFPSFHAAVKYWASVQPDKVCFTMLDPKAEVRAKMTYSELWQQSGVLASHLLSKGLKAGDRVVFLYPIFNVIDYMVAFLGCLRIGVVIVSIYPPNPKRLDGDLKKLQVFLQNSGATVALTTLEYKRFYQLSSITKKWPEGLREWVATDAIVSKSKMEAFVEHEPTDDQVSFIQYTSGSTGEPKGVPIHHQSLIICSTATSCLGLFVDTRLPIYHDFGLNTCLTTMMFGASIFINDPLTFIKDPLVWPTAIEKYKGNITFGPNFAFALTAKRMRDAKKRYDMSSLQLITLGAEPAFQSTIDDIVSEWGLPSEKITLSYGMAEACLGVTTGPVLFDSDTDVASCGLLSSAEKFGFKIVIGDKESGKVLQDGITGDIFLQGPGVVKEYYNNPEASKAFHYQLEGKEGKWYLTGDLGYIKDGTLFVNGRSKDVIIVNGKNIYPTDIERKIETDLTEYIRPGCSACFQTGSDTCAIVCEYRLGKEQLDPETLNQMKQHLDDEFGLQVTDILLCQKGTVPKTTSGKIRRSEAKKLFLNGEIKSVSQLSAGRKFETFQELLESYQVTDMSKTLVENGIDSLQLTRFIDTAKSQFGIDIDCTMAQSVACGQLQSASKKRGPPKPIMPENQPKDKPMPLFVVWQTFGVLLLLVVFAACTIPSAYFYNYITSKDFIINHQDAVDPLILTFGTRPGLLLIVTPLLWMLTLTLVMIFLKWMIIGYYKPINTSLWSYQFLRWWFVDRIVRIWERFVGGYLLDTPYINIIYWLMGVKTDIFTVRFKSFVREFDLVTCRSHASVSGLLLTRLIETRGLVMDTVEVGESTQVEGWATVYPGQRLQHDILEEANQPSYVVQAEKVSVFVQIQRILFPFVAIGVNLASLYLMYYLTSFWKNEPSVWIDMVLFMIFFVGSSLVYFFLVALLVRITSVLDWTVDRLAGLCHGMLFDFWLDGTYVSNLLLLLFGAKVTMLSQFNTWMIVAPSKAKYLTIGDRCTVSAAQFSPTKQHPIKIGNNCTVGILAILQEGAVVQDHATVATLAVVPKHTTVQGSTSFYTSTFSMACSKMNSSINNLNVTKMILTSLAVLVLTTWTAGALMIISSVTAVNYALKASSDMPLALLVPLMTLLGITVAATVIALADILAAWLFVPTLKDDEETEIHLDTLSAMLYNTHIRFSYIRRTNLSFFLGLTYMYPLLERMCGAKIDRLDRVLHDGCVYEPKALYLTLDGIDSQRRH
ncbi:hypothetical protein EDD86DRAFT_268132 [Gorgonomyces haynaldii]|nr:hypothetical protein EDD86DRAFT_268132 [Gorgonomyces haynaldii]